MKRRRLAMLALLGAASLLLAMLYLGSDEAPHADGAPPAGEISDDGPSGGGEDSPPLASSGEQAPTPPGPGVADDRREPVGKAEPAPPEADDGAPPEPVVTDPHPPQEPDPEPAPKQADLVGILEVA